MTMTKYSTSQVLLQESIVAVRVLCNCIIIQRDFSVLRAIFVCPVVGVNRPNSSVLVGFVAIWRAFFVCGESSVDVLSHMIVQIGTLVIHESLYFGMNGMFYCFSKVFLRYLGIIYLSFSSACFKSTHWKERKFVAVPSTIPLHLCLTTCAGPSASSRAAVQDVD